MSLFGILFNQLFTSLPAPSGSYTGKTVIVTGSNVGLGKEAARHYTRLGASKVILAVRSTSKGEAAKRDIEATTGTKNVVEVWQLDMSSYQSVLDFAAKAQKELDRLDIAVLNAGIAASKWEIFEKDESTITVNVVSTFLLALSLLPKLKETSSKFNVRPTLTIVASEVHLIAKFSERKAPEGKLFETLSTESASNFGDRYPTSKLLEVLAIKAIADKKSVSEIPVTINCINPGFCHSELARDASGFQYIMMKTMKLIFARTTEQGSRTLVHAGSAGPETHGQYLSDCKVTAPAALVVSPEGYKLRHQLWDELAAKLEAIKPGVTANL